MPWIKQTKKPCEHKSRPNLPSTYGNRHMIGDIWECDECQKQFEVIEGIQSRDMRGEPAGYGALRWRDYVPF